MSDDFTKLVKGNGAGPLTLNVERDTKELKFEISPRQNPPKGQGPLGVEITEVGLESQPFLTSLGSGLSETWVVTKMVFDGLGTFLGQLLSSPGNVQNVTGPVGIVFLAAQATNLGFVYFLQLLALISINLAVLNLLPFPALDGGRFLFILIEKLVGRSIPRQVQIWVNGAGFAILILLMVFITIKDVVRLI
jgi:regulator of sigma E protease